MSTPTPQEMTLDAIRSVPLFASLDDEAASDLRNLLRVQQVPSDASLFRAGDEGGITISGHDPRREGRG